MKIPGYDIFSGETREAMWLEITQELTVACDKMKEYARQIPGPYYVFSQDTREVVAHMNTAISEEMTTIPATLRVGHIS
jgi:hypothetical protein